MAKIATLTEVQTQWTLEDLLDANEALDIQEALEEEARATTP
jgi:hypothetical protein